MIDRITLNFAGCDVPHYMIIRVLFIAEFAAASENILSFFALFRLDSY